jgi:hypothetical protein
MFIEGAAELSGEHSGGAMRFQVHRAGQWVVLD